MSESIVKWLFTLAVVICITAITIATVHALEPAHSTFYCVFEDTGSASGLGNQFTCHN